MTVSSAGCPCYPAVSHGEPPPVREPRSLRNDGSRGLRRRPAGCNPPDRLVHRVHRQTARTKQRSWSCPRRGARPRKQSLRAMVTAPSEDIGTHRSRFISASSGASSATLSPEAARSARPSLRCQRTRPVTELAGSMISCDRVGMTCERNNHRRSVSLGLSNTDAMKRRCEARHGQWSKQSISE
jgi:hypothetical protein